MAINRPQAGGEVALGDDDLARIGLAVVFEAAAKAVTASALRALEALDEENWIKLERIQFKQILARICDRVDAIDDAELTVRFGEMEAAVEKSQEIRHMIVHAMWGEGGNGFLGYDYRRQRRLDGRDIAQAVEGCAEIKRAATWFAMRVANLVEDRVLPERKGGTGMSIRTDKGPVRL